MASIKMLRVPMIRVCARICNGNLRQGVRVASIGIVSDRQYGSLICMMQPELKVALKG